MSVRHFQDFRLSFRPFSSWFGRTFTRLKRILLSLDLCRLFHSTVRGSNHRGHFWRGSGPHLCQKMGSKFRLLFIYYYRPCSPAWIWTFLLPDYTFKNHTVPNDKRVGRTIAQTVKFHSKLQTSDNRRWIDCRWARLRHVTSYTNIRFHTPWFIMQTLQNDCRSSLKIPPSQTYVLYHWQKRNKHRLSKSLQDVRKHLCCRISH